MFFRLLAKVFWWFVTVWVCSVISALQLWHWIEQLVTSTLLSSSVMKVIQQIFSKETELCELTLTHFVSFEYLNQRPAQGGSRKAHIGCKADSYLTRLKQKDNYTGRSGVSAHPLTEQFKSKTELTIILTLTQSSIISSASIDPLSFSLIHPQCPPLLQTSVIPFTSFQPPLCCN